jgi:hypothetical protein
MMGDWSFVGLARMFISLMAKSLLEQEGSSCMISSIMIGPVRGTLSSFPPLEQPLGFDSFLECFIVMRWNRNFLLANFLCFSSTLEILSQIEPGC